MLTIRLPAGTEKRLEQHAKRMGRTTLSLAREAILAHLDDIEDLYLAERTFKRIHDGEEPTVPLKTVMKRYGMHC
jgi:RHH-type rel operon transcriptional repressor/antitoxin RelB